MLVTNPVHSIVILSVGDKKIPILNTCPHPCHFLVDGEVVEVPASPFVTAAKVEETFLREKSGITFVKAVPTGKPEQEQQLRKIKEQMPDLIIIGSIMAAQAYPGLVCSMIPAPGFERVPPGEKRMLPDKFTVFENAKEVQC